MSLNSSVTSSSSLTSSRSNPNSDMSMSVISASSSSRSSKSQSASSAVLLSASRKALICSSVRSSAIMQGIVSSPSSLAAFSRVWPAATTPSLSITTGTLNPNSLMDAATFSIALSFFLGFFSYGVSSSMLFWMISTRISFRGRLRPKIYPGGAGF